MTAAPHFTGRAALAKARPIGRANDHNHRGRFSRPTPITTNFPAGSVACGNQPALFKPISDRPGNSAPLAGESADHRAATVTRWPGGSGRLVGTPAPLDAPTPRRDRFLVGRQRGLDRPGFERFSTSENRTLNCVFEANSTGSEPR